MTDGLPGGILDAWGPVVLWAAGILLVTTVPVPAGLDAGAPPLDKVVHGAMYSGLGWTVARALHRTGRSTTGALILAVLAATGFAGLDEWHQAWVGRDPALGDWAADAVGLLVGLGVFLWRRGAGWPGSADAAEPGGDDGERSTMSS